MKAALYARRSTDEHQAQSLDVQMEEGRRFIEARGWTLDDAHIFLEDAVSRAEFVKRPALTSMRLAAERHEFDIVVTRDETRLGGDMMRTQLLITELLDNNIALFFYFTGEQVKLDGATAKFLMAAKNFASELEREKISQRVLEHLQTKARKGYNVGGRVFGYRNVEIKEGDRRLRVEYQIHPDQAIIVREIFSLYASGMGNRGIAKHLNERGIPSPRAGKRGTGSWSPSVVWAMVHNERYIGRIVYGRKQKTYKGGTKVRIDRDADQLTVIDAPELRIISDELWEAAKAQRNQRTSKPWKHTTGPKRHLLTGLAVCAECGGGIQASKGKQGDASIKKYGCGWHHDRGATVCANSLRQSVDDLDGALIGWIEKHVLQPNVVKKILSTLRRMVADHSAKTSGELPQLEAKIGKLRTELSNLAQAIAIGKGKLPALVTAMTTKQEELTKLEARMAILRSAPDVLTLEVRRIEKEALKRLSDLRGLMARSPEEARRIVASLLDGKLTLTPVKTSYAQFYEVDGNLTLGGLISGSGSGLIASPVGSDQSGAPVIGRFLRAEPQALGMRIKFAS